MLSHLKVFRSISNVHISDHDSNKLDTKSLKCTFIGYNINDFGYKFWDDHNKKVIRSRNVIFNGKVLYKDMSKYCVNGRIPWPWVLYIIYRLYKDAIHGKQIKVNKFSHDSSPIYVNYNLSNNIC